MAGTIEAYILALTSTMGQGIVATPTTVVASGTPTSGTTETLDAVLGTYQCSLVAGRRYMAVMDGILGNGNTVADLFALRIRNSGTSSAPTASSTLVAETGWYCAATGSGGRTSADFTGTFVAATSGTNTFGFFAQRIAGGGVFTPVSGLSGTLVRELYVLDIGVF